MKNIHVLPTDKPSRLQRFTDVDKIEFELTSKDEFFNKGMNIYITSDEEIKDKCYVLSEISIGSLYLDGIINTAAMLAEGQWKKIILTTDQDLIKDGVQAIEDDFLEYYIGVPFGEIKEVEVLKYKSNNMHKMNLGYKIIIPKEEPKNICIQTGLPCGVQCLSEETCNMIKPKQETLEEVAERLYGLADKYSKNRIGFIEGAKWQQQNSYSEEEVLEIIFQKRMPYMTDTEIIEWFEQFKKK